MFEDLNHIPEDKTSEDQDRDNPGFVPEHIRQEINKKIQDRIDQERKEGPGYIPERAD
jgi:hypothetical protein